MLDDTFADVDPDGGLAGLEPSRVDVDGTETRYYDVGDGEPLVLLHGGSWAGHSSANAWAPCIEPLAEEFRVLAFDRLGCGMTDNPDEPGGFSYREEIDHALGFLDAMALDTAHLCGSSRGAGLAARMAVEVPRRVETLLVTNSSTIGPPAGDYAFRRDRVFERPVAGLEPTDPAWIRAYYEQYCYRTEALTDEFCRTAAAMERQPKVQRAGEVLDRDDREEQWFESMTEHMRETRRRLADGVYGGPILYVLGRNDFNVPLEMGLRAFDTMAQGTASVRLELVNRCGHMVYREYPAEFARIVAGFVDRWR